MMVSDCGIDNSAIYAVGLSTLRVQHTPSRLLHQPVKNMRRSSSVAGGGVGINTKALSRTELTRCNHKAMAEVLKRVFQKAQLGDRQKY